MPAQLDTLKVVVNIVLTLVTVGWAALCSLPRLYRTHQAAVDQGVEKAKVVTCETKLKTMEKVVELKGKVVELAEAKLLMCEKAGQVKGKVMELAGVSCKKYDKL